MSDIEIGSVWVVKGRDNSTATVTQVADKGQVITYVLRDEETGNELTRQSSEAVFRSTYLPYSFVSVEPEIEDDTPKAVQILNEAVAIMAERGKSYDKSGGEAERSMPKIVAMFNALTGHELTPEQGWKFMCCLKLARSEQGEYREDNYIDGAAYMALAGEEVEASSE